MGQNFNVTHIYIDTVGKKETYQQNLNNDFNKLYPQLKFTVSEKADSKYVVVGAASICAKVTRDNEIKRISGLESAVPLGSAGRRCRCAPPLWWSRWM